MMGGGRDAEEKYAIAQSENGPVCFLRLNQEKLRLMKL